RGTDAPGDPRPLPATLPRCAVESEGRGPTSRVRWRPRPPRASPRPVGRARRTGRAGGSSPRETASPSPAPGGVGQPFFVDLALVDADRRPGHHHVPVGGPPEVQHPSGEPHLRFPTDKPRQAGGDERGARAGTTGE